MYVQFSNKNMKYNGSSLHTLYTSCLYWQVASRQAERRLKEVQQEATQLRNRLTLSEKNAVNHEDPKQKISKWFKLLVWKII